MSYGIEIVTDQPNACVWRGRSARRRMALQRPCADSPAPLPELHGDARAEAERCLERLQADAFHIRHVAAMRIAYLGPGVIPLLEPLLRTDRWSCQLDAVLDVLKRLGDSRSVPGIIALLDSSSEKVRLGAIRTLRWVSDDPAPFAAALEDTSWRIRREAVFALIELKREDIDSLFESMLRDNHAKVRAAAANGLGILCRTGHVPAILQLLDDPSEPVRDMALWSLRRMDGRVVRQHVLALLPRKAPQRDVVLAARALAVCPEHSVANAVIHAARTSGRRAQLETVTAVGALGFPEHLPFLESMLRDGTAPVRRAAAWAIGVHTLRNAARDRPR